MVSSESSHISDSKLPGLLAAAVTGGVAVGLVALSVPFVLPAVRKICLPYVPATTAQVYNVMKLLCKRNGNVIDLGSGDGRIVIEAAKLGYHSVGVELNPWLVLLSQLKAFREGVSANTKFKCQDLWKTDLTKYNNIIIFGVEQMMPKLEMKLSKELVSGHCVIACRFPLPNWKPVKSINAGIDTVWLDALYDFFVDDNALPLVDH